MTMKRLSLAVPLLLATTATHAATLVIRAEGVQSTENMVYAGI
jgi:hypothetical protein